MGGRNKFALSVVIPTRNRIKRLLLTLSFLEHQTVPQNEFEIIVVDDQSTQYKASDVMQSVDLPNLRVLSLEDAHPGYSRGKICLDLGLDRARGEIILFMDDDMLASPEFVNRHLNWHIGRQFCVVLGYRFHISIDYVLWHLSPHELRNFEQLSKYPHKKDERELILARRFNGDLENHPQTWRFGFTCNLSFPRKLLDAVGTFDTRFKGWGVSDQEFCYRLCQTGSKFVFDREAAAYHQVHPVSLSQRKEWRRNVRILLDIHPELREVVEEELERYEWVIKRQRHPLFIREVYELAKELNGVVDPRQRRITFDSLVPSVNQVHSCLREWLYAIEDNICYLLRSPSTDSTNCLGYRIQM